MHCLKFCSRCSLLEELRILSYNVSQISQVISGEQQLDPYYEWIKRGRLNE